jgi:hypothetical protein
MGLGLLRLPRLPDVRKPSGTELFVPSSMELDSVRYKDKAREKQRQQVGGRLLVLGWLACLGGCGSAAGGARGGVRW